MKKIYIVLIILAALAIGVGGAYFAARAIQDRIEIRSYEGNFQELPPDFRNLPGFEGRMPFDQWGPRLDKEFGELPWYKGNGSEKQDDLVQEKITMEDAIKKAQEYVASMNNDNLEVSEVKQFEKNFFAVVRESDTKMGAFQIMIDPYGDVVTARVRPLLEWNTKYSQEAIAQGDAVQKNTVSMVDAAAAAAQEVKDKVAGAEVDVKGIEFYGYYTFTYKVDGKIAGLVSVNGMDNSVWVHTSHGDFIAEKEVSK